MVSNQAGTTAYCMNSIGTIAIGQSPFYFDRTLFTLSFIRAVDMFILGEYLCIHDHKLPFIHNIVRQ